MNTFTHIKCYNFGVMCREKHNMEWSVFQTEDGWSDFVKRRELTDTQLFFVKKGFNGEGFAEPETEDIMPFQPFKGRPMSEMTEKYIRYLAKQDWLHKWPNVALFVKRKMESYPKGASIDEVKSILQHIP